MAGNLPDKDVVDNFLIDFDVVNDVIQNTDFGNFQLNGKAYTGFCNTLLPVKGLMEEYLGFKIAIQLGHLRMGNKNTPLTHFIHADNYGCNRAMVLFFNEPACETGTAFWRHRELGIDRLPEDCSAELFNKLDSDIKNPSLWEMIDYIPVKKNRAVFFNGLLFHSRFPEHLPIEETETPRLNLAVFWRPI
jgi:hypothetical protein